MKHADLTEAQRELARMNATLDRFDPWIIFVHARRMANREYQRAQNWVFVARLFGLGSTYAFAMCRRMDVDPESTKAERITPAGRRALQESDPAKETSDDR